MNTPPHIEAEIDLAAGPLAHKALVRTPQNLSRDPALLIFLGGTRRNSLEGEWFRIVPDIFLAAGHRVASFDLPKHGDRREGDAEGLSGMARAVARGEDVFAELQATGRALVDACIAHGYADPARVVAAGTSRGGLGALHLAAADTRVRAFAMFWPVTYLPVLQEFRELADHPIVRRSNADALIPSVAGRPAFIAMAQTDLRVGADACRAFHSKLFAASRGGAEPELFCPGGQSHGPTCPLGAGYLAGAAFLLRWCALQMMVSE